jgi:hypothetical protein
MQLAVNKALYSVLGERRLFRERYIRNPIPKGFQATLSKHSKKLIKVKELRRKYGNTILIASLNQLIQNSILVEPNKIGLEVEESNREGERDNIEDHSTIKHS